jgi:hypothetical protein
MKKLFLLTLISVLTNNSLCTSNTTRGGLLLGAGIVTSMGISSSKISSTNSTAGFQIQHSGYYYLSNDLVYNASTSGKPCIKIEVSDVVLDLGTKTIYLSGTSNSLGIEIAAGCKNVLIKGGNINGMKNTSIKLSGSNGNEITGISIESVKINNSTIPSSVAAPVFLAEYVKQLVIKNCSFNNHTVTETGQAVIELDNCNSIQFEDSTVTSNKNFLQGIYENASNDISLKNIMISDCTTTSGNFSGIYLANSIVSKFYNVLVADNEATAGSIYGFYLSSSANDNTFNACMAKSNIGLNGTYGYYFNNASTNNLINCEASGNYAKDATDDAFATGFYLASSSNANSFEHCTAKRNTVKQAAASGKTIVSAGFYLDSSKSNRFKICSSLNHSVEAVKAESANNGISAGFFSKSGASNSFDECEAIYNGAIYSSEGEDTAPELIATGFYFDNETSSSISRCKSSGNSSQLHNTSHETYSYGVLFDKVAGKCARCTMLNSYLEGNIQSGTATRTGGHSFGFYDNAIDEYDAGESTSYLKANTSFGHGHVFDGTEVRDPETYDMNYYLKFEGDLTAMNPMNIIKEADIANLNIIAESGGKDLFNWSIVTDAVA